MSEYYQTLSWKKEHIIVSPDELSLILDSFHHVRYHAVNKGYTESNPFDFINRYKSLYCKLALGNKLVWAQDHELLSFSSGLTGAISNCQYSPCRNKLVPNFLEPCILIEPFCFFMYKEKLSTSFATFQFPENTVGLRISFPSSLEYITPTERHHVGIVSGSDLTDYATFQTLRSRIHLTTKPLRFKIKDKLYRPTVRISDQAKKDIQNFYFFTHNSVDII